jgi:hypothetical protein
LTIGCLKVKQPGTPSLGGNPRPFAGHDLVGFVHEVAHDLPANRRVRIQQPLYDGFPLLGGFLLARLGRHLPLAPFLLCAERVFEEKYLIARGANQIFDY